MAWNFPLLVIYIIIICIYSYFKSPELPAVKSICRVNFSWFKRSVLKLFYDRHFLMKRVFHFWICSCLSRKRKSSTLLPTPLCKCKAGWLISRSPRCVLQPQETLKNKLFLPFLLPPICHYTIAKFLKLSWPLWSRILAKLLLMVPIWQNSCCGSVFLSKCFKWKISGVTVLWVVKWIPVSLFGILPISYLLAVECYS